MTHPIHALTAETETSPHPREGGRDRPIIFSGPMILALLAGRKTQTRRILKPKKGVTILDCTEDAGPALGGMARRMDLPLDLFQRPYAVGDWLWVREAWQTGSGFNGPQIAYKATGDTHDVEAWDGDDEGAGPSFNYERCPGAKWHTWLPDLLSGTEGAWRPSIHMPRWASRMTLAVTDVRVERLQDISEADAWAEGCKKGEADDVGGFFPADEPDPSGIGLRGWDNARDWFADLWEEINGEDSWEANPWVAAVSFTVHHANIDALPTPCLSGQPGGER